MERIFFGDYDLTFAVEIRQQMLYNKWEGLDFSLKKFHQLLEESLWDPIQNFLKGFADTKPKQAMFFCGSIFNFPRKQGCKCQNVFIVNHLWQVAYVGTLFNEQAVICDNALMAGFGKIDPTYIVIPSDSEYLDERIAIKAIANYLRQRYKKTSIPKLAKCICLLSKELGEKLNKIIREEADHLAKKESL